jgi:hypothetical protein
MKVRDTLSKYRFEETSENTFQRDSWELRLEKENFELFSDPEIDTRYYLGSLNNLERYLQAIS